MPELPEVEVTRLGILPFIENEKIVRMTLREPRLRWLVDHDLPLKIQGKNLEMLTRRGKYLLWKIGHGHLLIHLGMSGKLNILEKWKSPEKHDHWDIEFNNGCHIRYTDPRRFGALVWTEEAIESHKLLIHLGPEPLTDAFNASYLMMALKSRKTPIKTSLMDAQLVVGVGNIYANEALYQARISPLRMSNTVTLAELKRLVTAIKKILAQAIAIGGTTLRDYRQSDGSLGYFAQKLKVYGRGELPCYRCKTPLTETRLNNRSTVFCEHCT